MFSHLQTFSDLRRGLTPSVKKTRLEEGKNSAPAQRWVQSSLTPGIGWWDLLCAGWAESPGGGFSRQVLQQHGASRAEEEPQLCQGLWFPG